MKTFLFDSLNRFRRYSQELDTMAEIRKCLCGKAWLVFNNSGDKEVYIFKEDGSLIISINGSVTKGSWEYLSENKSVIISASNQEYMVHPAFLDNILFALQVDGTENYAFLIDQINKQNFAPQSLDDLYRYFREKEQKRIEEENRKREEQRLAELKRIEKEKKEREERERRERRERKQREEEQKNRLAEKIYKDEIIKPIRLWLFVAHLFVAFSTGCSSYILYSDYPRLSVICYLVSILYLVLFICLVNFLFYFPLSLIFRFRLKKFIKNNITYSGDMLYRLVKYHNDRVTSFGIEELKAYDSLEDCNAIIHTESNTLIRGCENTIIPPSVTEIGEHAFWGCKSLTSIIIPESVTKIGFCAFYGCSSLTSIIVSKDNKVYDSREDCNAIIHTESNTLISGCKNTIIPASVTKIGFGAFWGCSSLTSISIPPSVTEIGRSAFWGCSSLTSISIPPSVTKIGFGAFDGCSSLTSISVSKDNKVYDSREDCNAIIHTESNTLISGCKNTIIPPSVTVIGHDAFSGCSSLTSISIPPSVTKIGGGAFWRCSSLTSISIPSSVTEIGNWAFYGCSSLTSITIPESVTEIGEKAFCDCTSLTEVRIPKGCNVHKDAFKDCPKVKIIRY